VQVRQQLFNLLSLLEPLKILVIALFSDVAFLLAIECEVLQLGLAELDIVN
jgi:hypothetical protein